MYNWDSLAYHGDEWFAAYACIPGVAVSPIWFSVGHAVELYLKSAHTKLFGDIKVAIQYGDKIKDLWDECRKHDPSFMDGYAFRDHIFAMNLLDGRGFKRFSADDQKHLRQNRPLYAVFKHIQDLKYLGTPLKTHSGPWALGYVHPDPYWIEFVRTLRAYLGYPSQGRADRISQILEVGRLPDSAAAYLRELYHD
jgi:hypothetical protein